MADPNNEADLALQDLYLFRNINDQEGHGVLHHVPADKWQTPEFEIPVGMATAVRDMLGNGAAVIGRPMDMPFEPGRIYFVAHLELIHHHRMSKHRMPALTSSGAPHEPGSTPDGVAETTDKARDDSEKPRGNPIAEPKDLFLLAPPRDKSSRPKLYKLPEAMYAAYPPPPEDAAASPQDMISQGVVLAAMPPTAGTLCYLISLASLSEYNQAFNRR